MCLKTKFGPILRCFAFALVSVLIFHWNSGVAHAQTAGIRIGFFPNVTHAQALYARATGYFDQAVGTRIEWVAFNAGPSAVEALFSGAIDASFVGPSPTINGYLKSHGEKFVVVCGAASGGAALVVRPAAGIKTAKDFGGKTLATPQLGNTQDVAARLWLLDHGYRLKAQGGTVNLIPLSNPDQLTMFKRGQIDAAWTIEPWVSRLELEGGGRVFLEEKELWAGGKYVTTHLVVSRALLKQRPEQVKKLVRALVEVTQKINADKAAAGVLINEQIRKDTSKAMPGEVVQRALSRVELTWDPVTASLSKNAEGAHRVGFVSGKPNLKGIYELGVLAEVLREKNLPPLPESETK